ncbi:TetR family transcriptional regulator [Seongchinamella sediminis]|uniref:TetR family transcriptional regulator n=1 Tax=Seongchinamella sediminis TaxID=2283635 RepID=A0A3L7DZ63_9GAMM|nr:TetR/AcrR family transcriptional regulator [Seongchinamella sediminis]RLQ21959.1 TetR family transcriptional regulator [Seongchinamella sediminis]
MQHSSPLIPNDSLPERVRLRSEPKQKRTQAAFDRILDAAIDLALARGLSTINTNMIAEQADLDIASLYRIFPNKEAILYWAAERWLAKIRASCVAMEEEGLLELPWREFFARHGEMIAALPESDKAYTLLMPFWASYPEFQRMLDLHYEYMTRFFVRHLRRYGAGRSEKYLAHLARYLMITSDSIRDIAPTMGSDREQAFYRLDYETWIFHLARVLED